MKNSAAGDFVRALARGESCFVNAIVHIVVDKIGEFRVVGLDFFWEKVDLFTSGKVVKHVIEHAADVVLAIVHDPLCFRVPEDRHSHAGLITRLGRFVGFTQKLKAVNTSIYMKYQCFHWMLSILNSIH